MDCTAGCMDAAVSLPDIWRPALWWRYAKELVLALILGIVLAAVAQLRLDCRVMVLTDETGRPLTGEIGQLLTDDLRRCRAKLVAFFL